MTKKEKTGDYQVGYGKPPDATRFKRGQSGNPKGRPRKPKVEELDVAGILAASVEMSLEGKVKIVSAFEASTWRLAERAMNGKVRDIKKFIDLCEKHGVIAEHTNNEGGVIFAPKGISPEDWIKSQNPVDQD